MFAIIETGGKQYRVQKDDVFKVEKLKAEVGETVTFENIVHEYRVEFAFEDHRYWDMKRWRLADKVWNGNNNDPQARHRRLWPYRVVAPGDPNDGKWVFVEDFLFMSPNARYFRMQNYYNFLDLGWVNNNPKLVKNPYQ